MRNSMESGYSEIKDVKGRRSIRDGSEEMNFLGRPNRMKLNNNEDRSNSEPPRSYASYLPAASTSRLKPIREKNREDAHGSSDEDGELSKSNSQLNESDFDLEIPDSASASVSQTPTPTPLASSHARRINSETNLNDSKRRLSGFMGNRSKRFCASTSELSFSSHLDTNKSLFSTKNNALSRQSFNSSLYGSNLSLSSTNSRLFMVNSPFYNGKTMFGGASAYPKRDINQHKILRTPIQMRPSSSLSNSSNTSAKSDNVVPESNAAKRILEIMNQFSGPIKEARTMGNNINSIIKIPSLVQNRKRYGEDELSLDRSIALSTPSAPYGRPLTSTSSRTRPESPLLNSPIIKPLQIPTMSQLLQMKRLQNNTERVREIASRSDSFLNRNQEYKLPSASDDSHHQNSTGGSSLKMKSNITKNLLRQGSLNEQLPALPVNLPNIQLPQLKSIPKFDIPRTAVSTPTGVVKATVPAKSITQPPTVQFNSFKSSPTTSLTATMSEYRFSPPSLQIGKLFDISCLEQIDTDFNFANPWKIDEVPRSVEIKSQPIKAVTTLPAIDNRFAKIVADQKSGLWNCDSCYAQNDLEKTKCLCCNVTKKDSGIASQSLSSSITAPPADSFFKDFVAKNQSSKWNCPVCAATNQVTQEKCPCCGEAKPGAITKPASSSNLSSASTFSFGMPAVTNNPPAVNSDDDTFKKIVEDQKSAHWSCEDCMASNKATSDKCACCGGAKPGSASTTKSPSFGTNSTPNSTFSFGMPAPKDVEFKKIVEKQNANWECSTCMTRNDASKLKCVCCEQAKPGSNPDAPTFSFGSKLTSSVSLPAPSEVKFSFGIPAAKVDTPIDSKKEEPSKPENDEVDKPKPTFSFGMNNSVEVPKPAEVSSVASAPTFTFKAPASTSSSVAATFTLKSPIEEKKTEISEKSSLFAFGNSQPSVAEPVKLLSFGIEAKAPEPIKPSVVEPAKAEEPKSKEAGGFHFSKNGDFSFVKTSEPSPAAEPIKEVPKTLPSSGFSFGTANSSISFGSNLSTITSASAPSTNSFLFGASKAENEAPKTFGSFGNSTMSVSPVKTTFGVTSVQSAPLFGQTNASTSGGFSFTATKKDEVAPAQVFAFGGAKPTAPGNTPMLFGNNQMNSSQTVTPMFGATSVPTFGSTTSNNNNESGFGSKMPSFSSNQPQKRAFEFTSHASEVSQPKKLDFGSQQQQMTAAPFQFNAQGADIKPAFNFTASAQPSFNFTSNTAANNLQDQQNLFQFGANNSHSTQGIFAFAPNSAPVMQFGAGTGAQQLGMQGLPAFSAQGTNSAAANQRKILRASRRATRR